jgi:c-di-AMP phosphodiesterase-like protein
MLNKERYTIEISKSSESLMSARPRKRKGWYLLILILIALMVYSFFIEQEANGWILLVRVIVVMIVFYKVIGPLLAKVLASFIKKYRSSNTSYIQYVLDALPYTGAITKKAWKENHHRPFIGKIRHFIIDVIMYQLYFIPK